MESKAYEKLGILRPKRTFGSVVRSIFRKMVLLCILVACAWLGFRHFMGRRGGGALSSPAAVVAKDDGSMFVREHLSVEKVMQYDLRTREIDGRIVPVERQYAYKLTIDEKWYCDKFVPRIKQYLAEIAPAAEKEEVTFDTHELAYANDGADRLRKRGAFWMQNGDSFRWPVSRSAMRHSRDGSARRHERHVLLLGGKKDNGATTLGTLYTIEEAQFDKLENWISQCVLRDRAEISATVTSGGEELASRSWAMRDVRPISLVNCAYPRCYVISPWIDVCLGQRCRFLGIRCMRQEGVPDDVDVRWSL